MANEVGGGASEAAETTLSPPTDDNQIGVLACRNLEERDARIAMGNNDVVLHPEIPKGN